MLNIQNFDDTERFKWCLIRYLNPVNHHPAKIRKVDKLFADELDLEDIKFPVKVKDVHKIEKRILLALVLLVMKAKKNLVSRNTFEKHIDLLSIEEKKGYTLIKDFNTFMCHHT